MSTRQEQTWAVGALAIIAIVAAVIVLIASSVLASSGSWSKSSPEGGFRSNQTWHLFDGEGQACHVSFWSVNENRSIHGNTMVVVDTTGNTSTLAVERFQGTTDRAAWHSTAAGEVYVQLILDEERRSSADYYAVWECEEAPTSTTTPSTVTTSTLGGSTTTSTPPDSTVTTTTPDTSSTTTTVPVTTSVPSSPPSSPGTNSPPTVLPPSTVPPSTPTGVPTGEG